MASLALWFSVALVAAALSKRIPIRGIGLLRLLVGFPIFAPLYIGTWLAARRARRRLTRPEEVQALLEQLGLFCPGTDGLGETRIQTDGHSNATLLVTVERAGQTTRMVLKRALAHGSFLASLGRFVGPMPYATGIGTRGRTRREAIALERLADRAGLRTPRLLAAKPDASLLAMEWIEGEPLAPALFDGQGAHLAEQFGRALAEVHRAGIALCDGHPANALIETHPAPRAGAQDCDGRLVLLDFEFATCGPEATATRIAFDLAYAASFMPDANLRAALLRGYGALDAGQAARVERATRGLIPFAPFLRLELHSEGVRTRGLAQRAVASQQGHE